MLLYRNARAVRLRKKLDQLNNKNNCSNEIDRCLTAIQGPRPLDTYGENNCSTTAMGPQVIDENELNDLSSHIRNAFV